MIEFISSLNMFPTSVWLLMNAVIVSLLGFYLSRKKTGAEVADLITQGAERNIEVYEKRLTQMEGRIASLEHNERVNSAAMEELEEKLRKWNDGIQILINQIEERHNSKPDWRPGEG